MITIYHNNRCSKSRACLTLLQNQQDHKIQIIDYIKTPLNVAQLTQLHSQLAVNAIEMVRTNEPEWKPYKGQDLSDTQIIDLLATYPKLLQRPIVVQNNKAMIVRPVEKIFEWIPVQSQ